MTNYSQVDTFFSRFPLIRFPINSTILSAGNTIDMVYLIKSGLVRQFAVSPAGEIFLLHLYKSGDILPPIFLMDTPVNNYYYDAFTPVTAYKTPAVIINEFIRSRPEFLYELTDRLSQNLMGLSARMEMLSVGTAYNKTLALLNYLAKTYGETVGTRTLIPARFTHRELANWIGTSRETVSIQMEHLQKEGLIGYQRRRIIIKASLIDSVG